MAVTKDYILEEIRRTAAQNGDVPLGRRRFALETGINESDWFGKIWARWGDALREAGLQPNELQGAFVEREIIEAYIGLMRELGRLPVAAELRLKRGSDPAFPSHNVFERLGPRSRLLERLLEYSRERSGYDDIAELCESNISNQTRAPNSQQSGTNVEMGDVYLMKSGRYYKIGRSNAAGRRGYELAIQLPESVSTIHVIKTDDPAGIEAYWHHRFKQKRKGGEWFDLAPADVAAFKRRKLM